MNHATHNRIISFIWKIADDVLRDVYKRGKYRDIILPMTVIRRLDALLEPTKAAVLQRNAQLDDMQLPPDDRYANLTHASGQKFYNTSEYTLATLLSDPGAIRTNFESYLLGFSRNIRDILEKFRIFTELNSLHEAGRLYLLIQNFVSPDINLAPYAIEDGRGNILHEKLTNHGMGYVFEELLRKFNEENNEEAGEHFTPRDVIELMTNLLVLPVREQIQGGTFLIYDPACGSGGMLTETEATLRELMAQDGKRVTTKLYGQEVNPETYAICTADMLIHGNDPANIRHDSTLSADNFRDYKFDLMIANPPYGKSWKAEQEQLSTGKKKEMSDPRFSAQHQGKTLALVPRSSDGQLLFTVTMLSKMKPVELPRAFGSRVAVIHNGSALFTGDAGSGESNIRRWIVENDWLEAIIGLPLNMFYNTGIATYVWVFSNNKPAARRGKVQLIDATRRFEKLRKNLGQKNCKLSERDIAAITDLFLRFEESDESKLFDNADFGYTKITVERPLRYRVEVTPERAQSYAQAYPDRSDLIEAVADALGGRVWMSFAGAQATAREALAADPLFAFGRADVKLFDQFLLACADKDPAADPVVKKITRGTVEYEADPELRDTENVPLSEDIAAYMAREVLPYHPDAWVDQSKNTVGYEISFTKHFYSYEAPRPLAEITADIRALEQETDGLLNRLLNALEGERA